jgi:hypothetical protein
MSDEQSLIVGLKKRQRERGREREREGSSLFLNNIQQPTYQVQTF